MKLIALFLLLTNLAVCSSFDDVQEILPRFEVGQANILFENLIDNADQVPQFESFEQVKPLHFLKNPILKIPSENTFIIRQDLENSLSDPNYSANTLQNVTIGQKAGLLRSRKFNQYIFKNPESRIKSESYGCIPNNSTSPANYAFERSFEMQTSIELATSFAYVFGFFPKFSVGFTKGGGIKFEVTCNVDPGNCVQLEKLYTEYLWKDVTRRQIVVSGSSIRRHLKFHNFEKLPEISMIDKSTLHFSCVTFNEDGAEHSDTRQEE